MTTATLPRRIIRPVATPPARRSMLFGFVATLLLGVLAVAGTSAAVAILGEGQVLAGVRVGGVSVGGLDREAAAARLGAELPALETGRVVIDAGETEITVAYADLGRGYDLDAMVDAAMAVGRGEGLAADAIARLRSFVHPTTLPVLVHQFDPEALEAAAVQVSRAVSQYPVEARVRAADFSVQPGADGRVLAPETVRTAIAAALDSNSPADVRLSLATVPVPPVVSTQEAEGAAAAARATAADLVLTVDGAGEGEEPLSISAETIRSWISFGPLGKHDYAMRLDTAAARDAIAAFADAVHRGPVSARFEVAGSGLGGVVPGQTGRDLNVEESANALLAVLGKRAGGASVASMALVADVTEPALTTAAAEAILPQMEKVSSWTTTYVVGEGNGYGNNVSIPAWDIDGYNLAPGEWFSFWDAVGPVTVERGYRYGGAIINGRSVANGALAGGICSTSTTIFNAALRAGLEIGQRENHYYYIDRYPVGLDATVSIFDGWVTDVTFRNDTQYPIVIRGFGTPGRVTFEIWSAPTGRTVELSDPVITDRRAAGDTTQVDPSMAPGTSRRVEYPTDGMNVTVLRTVYASDGSVLHDNTWYSDYRVVDGITLVGPNRAAPERPADEAAGDGAGEAGTGDAPPSDEDASGEEA